MNVDEIEKRAYERRIQFLKNALTSMGNQINEMHKREKQDKVQLQEIMDCRDRVQRQADERKKELRLYKIQVAKDKDEYTSTKEKILSITQENSNLQEQNEELEIEHKILQRKYSKIQLNLDLTTQSYEKKLERIGNETKILRR